MTGSYSGSGSYRGGGSLSSSNLSALAPPFQVDKSLPKPNSTNPSMNYPEVPIYGTLFDPPGSFWNSSSPSSASGPKFVATETMGTNTTCAPSPSIYGYTGSQSSNSLYYVDSNTGAAYDPFSYDQFSHSVSARANEAAKPYYPSYVPLSPQKDGYSGLGLVAGPGYDLLSTSASANLSGCGSSQVDHTQGVSVSGGEYKPKWGDFWMGVDDSEHGKWTEYARGFGSKEINVSVLSNDKNHIFVDGSNKSRPSIDGSSKTHHFGDGSNKNHLKQGASLSQGLYSNGKVTTVSDNCFDIFGGTYSFGGLGIGPQDCNSSFNLNSGGPSTGCSKLPTFISASASKESPHLQEPVLESVTSFCGSEKAHGPSLEEHFSQTGPFVFRCTSATSTFPITVSKFSYSGSNLSTSTLSATKVNSMGSDVANKSSTTAGYDFSYQKEPQGARGSKCQSGITIRRPLSSFMPASLSKIGAAVDRADDKLASDNTKFRPQVPQQFSSDGFGQENTDDAEAMYSLEKHSGGSEVHNPAEDSPCWKGASSSHFSPFGVPEAVASDVLVEKLDGCNNLNSQELQKKGVFVGTFDSIDFSSKEISLNSFQNESGLVDTSDSIVSSSEKVNESTSLKRPYFSTGTLKHHEDFGSVNQKPHCFDLNTTGAGQFADDCPVYIEDVCELNKTKTDSYSSFGTQKIFKDGEVASPTNLFDAAAAEKNDSCTPVAADNFSAVPSNIGDNLSSSPPGDKSSLKYCQSPRKVSNSRIDINVLLQTMTNLSEVFLRQCVSNLAAVTEQHSVTIKHIIDNLNASMLMMAGPATPAMTASMQGTSLAAEVNNTEAVAAAVKLCRKTEDFLDSVSFKDDANTTGDYNNTETIKKILHENLHNEEEMDQQKLLYRNLWLEAEAALCAMSAKARLHRMKSEMGKIHGSTIDTEKPPASKNSSEVPSVVEFASKVKDSPALVACDHESPKLGTTSQCDHTETSVMSKFHILNSQVTSSNPIKFEGPKTVTKEVCSSSLDASSPGACGNDLDGSNMTSHANDADASVTTRYQILKDRIDKSDSLKYEGKHSEENCLLDKDYLSLDTLSNDLRGSGLTSRANDVESSALAGYQILKCQIDSSDCLNCEGKQSSGEEDFLLDGVSLNQDKPLDDSQESQLSNSVGVIDDNEASVMARFLILQSRINGSNSVNKENPAPGQASRAPAEDGIQGMGLSQQTFNVMRSTFGPYPDFTEEEDDVVKEFGVCVDGNASTQSCEGNKLSSEIFEGWYDNDYTSLDWEHVSKEDLRRQT